MTTTQSAFDLLARTRAQQPEFVAQEVMHAMGAGGVQWRDPPDPTQPWRNLDHLRPGGKVPTAWRAFWPQDEHPITWDAIGRAQFGRAGCWSWVTVRAMAHPGELEPQPTPPDAASDQRIRDAVAFAQERFHTDAAPSWVDAHYRLALPLVAFAHQRAMGSCARLLFAHFFVDSPDEWQEPLARRNERMGLTGKSVYERHVYRMFLPMP